MGIFKRALVISEAKINKSLNRVEDPNEILDLSYEKMLICLQDIKHHLAEVVTEQKRLEAKIKQMKISISERESEARTALKLGKEDLATRALELKQTETEKMQELDSGLQFIVQQVTKLKDSEVTYRQRIEKFRQQKELSKASYEAVQAQVKVKESITGINQSLGDIGNAMERAKEQNEVMQARATAIDSLIDEGILSDPLAGKNDINSELNQLKKQSAIADELAKLKAEIRG